MKKDIKTHFSPDPDDAYRIISGEHPASIDDIPGVTFIPTRDGVRSKESLEEAAGQSPIKEIIGEHHKKGKFVFIKTQAMGVAVYVAKHPEFIVGAAAAGALGMVEVERRRRRKKG